MISPGDDATGYKPWARDIHWQSNSAASAALSLERECESTPKVNRRQPLAPGAEEERLVQHLTEKAAGRQP